jgi:molybdopterin-guanine dinucleotide biosynthesis protein A
MLILEKNADMGPPGNNLLLQSAGKIDGRCSPPLFPAVVLAGGRARRMGGGDKPLLLLGGRTLLAHVLARIAPQVGAVAVSANGDAARFGAFGLPVLADERADFAGPLCGVLAGLRWAARGFPATTHVLSVPGDTPFLPDNLVVRLAAALDDRAGGIVCAESGGRLHPTVALWPVQAADRLAAAIAAGERRVLDFARAQGLKVAAFPTDADDPLFNVNTPADLAMAEAILRRRR